MTGACNARMRRRRLVPEVVQTSAMDCGPAALKCLLAGFGMQVSYGRLRDACQTDIDGTSIDTVEAVACQLGFDAEQVLLPVDHLLLEQSAALPAVVLVRLPNGFTHFVVLWSVHGPLVQVMDPATGRRFMGRDEFLSSVYVHVAPIAASAFRQWAAGERFLAPLRVRLARLGCARAGAAHIQSALRDAGAGALARLDAATRMLDSIVRSRALRRGAQAEAALGSLLEHSASEPAGEASLIPDLFWTVKPLPDAEDGEAQVLARGAVLVSVRGLAEREPAADRTSPGARPSRPDVHDRRSSLSREPLSPALQAALNEPPPRPLRHLVRGLLRDGRSNVALLMVGVMLSGAGVALEALLFRCLFDLGWSLRLPDQRLFAVGLVLGFGLLLLCLELPVIAGLLRLGRNLETRLRIAFLERMPRVDERYFESRPTSDIAERSHGIHRIRLLPSVAGRLFRSVCELCATTAGVIWLEPSAAPLALTTAAVMLLLPLLMQPLLAERDLRVRTHAAAMSRFNLDALLGLMAVRASGAERALRREHDSLLLEWAKAARACLRVVVTTDALQALLGYGLCAWLFISVVRREAEVASPLLLLYWTLSLPVLGHELGLIARQLPLHRNLTLRLLELLSVPVRGASADALPETHADSDTVEQSRSVIAEAPRGGRGVAIELHDVCVRAAGHTVLDDVSLSIAAGSHVAIVGASGAGKSSLLGLLLGFHRPASGTLRIDDRELTAAVLAELRAQTAWVDPSVQLWNRSLLDNLSYGAADAHGARAASILHAAELRSVLEKLPDGLQTLLGEHGGLLSGGEGQRVRFGRALHRPDARLVILDEPFRGLDRERRHALLARAREAWRDATLLCVTHDLDETHTFERVLVIDGGRVLQDGAPDALLAQPDSRYRALIEAERSVRAGFWTDPSWRRLRMQRGRLAEG